MVGHSASPYRALARRLCPLIQLPVSFGEPRFVWSRLGDSKVEVSPDYPRPQSDPDRVSRLLGIDPDQRCSRGGRGAVDGHPVPSKGLSGPSLDNLCGMVEAGSEAEDRLSPGAFWNTRLCEPKHRDQSHRPAYRSSRSAGLLAPQVLRRDRPRLDRRSARPRRRPPGPLAAAARRSSDLRRHRARVCPSCVQTPRPRYSSSNPSPTTPSASPTHCARGTETAPSAYWTTNPHRVPCCSNASTPTAPSPSSATTWPDCRSCPNSSPASAAVHAPAGLRRLSDFGADLLDRVPRALRSCAIHRNTAL